ncbi:hypothetical protein ACSBR1_026164 [Camellia fascicularis]
MAVASVSKPPPLLHTITISIHFCLKETSLSSLLIPEEPLSTLSQSFTMILGPLSRDSAGANIAHNKAIRVGSEAIVVHTMHIYVYV